MIDVRHPPGLHLGLGALHGQRRVLGDHLRDRDRPRDQRGRLDDLAHDAPLLGLLGLDAVAGEQHVGGGGGVDDARQVVHGVAGHDPSARLEEPDVGVARHDADVAVEGDLAAAADREPVDRGDERLGAAGEGHLLDGAVGTAAGDVRAAGGAVGGLLEVHARAEGAPGAGEDADAHLRVGVEVADGRVELGHEGAAEGVEPFGRFSVKIA